MDSLEAFLHPTILTGHTTHTYETHAAIDNASRYASNTSNIGVDEVRKLAKTAKMLGDPDMEDHLARMTEKFCEHMFNVCELIKAVKANRATQGLQLIACELSARTHGPNEWWVMVENGAVPKPVVGGNGKGKGKGKGGK